MRPLPDTTCPTCRWAEMTLLQHLIERLQPPTAASLIGVYADGMARSIATFTGTTAPTWADRHREAYVSTGDRRELTRMERHITKEQQ